MRTRSSRFFVVLLHLVGVCQDRYEGVFFSSSSSGIPGVQPRPVQLESVTLSSYFESDEVENNDEWMPEDMACLMDHRRVTQCQSLEPLWLQDPADALCLGPTGRFTECGDATLWFVQKQRIQHGMQGREKRLFLSGLVSQPKAEAPAAASSDRPVVSWTFQVVDNELLEGDSITQRGGATECLEPLEGGDIQVRSCRRRKRQKQRVQSWLIDSFGRIRKYSVDGSGNMGLCLQRNGTKAVMGECTASSEQQQKSQMKAIDFEFVRYRAVAVSNFDMQTTQAHESSRDRNGREKKPQKSAPKRDKPRIQISEPQMHPELKLSSQRFLFTSKEMGHRKTEERRKERPPFALLRDTNPILLAARTAEVPVSAPSASLLHPVSVDEESVRNSGTMKAMRIFTHPYIEQAVQEVWTDPQTGLEYRTDLCHYLGNDRREHGRHTLMGVGQYRKGYVIKVYGVAYYVSKRDVLADPSFAQYASLSAEELRQNPGFYLHLREMDLSGSPSGKFDRTLLLKINMQLSVETMRSSLQAEWELLTDEAKASLASASLEPREADEDMLKIIRSPENPSRCSCSQTAPAEYQADPGCCARGTELAFTWLKNGDLQIRLNGRLMQTFERPDIPRGVFYDYLRYDDPISPELREHVVDGFPFLLAPLAQVKGVKMGQQSHVRENVGKNPLLLAVGGFVESISAQADDMARTLQKNAIAAASHAQHTAISMRTMAQSFAQEMNHRREMLMRSAATLPDAAMSMLSPHRRKMAESLTAWDQRNMTPSVDAVRLQRKSPVGRVFGYPLWRYFGDTYYHAPDEIGPMKIHPEMNTTRKVFLALVHLYLLLLFIVSFPGSYSTRTKLVIRKTLSCGELSVQSAVSCGSGRLLSNSTSKRISSHGDLLLYEKNRTLFNCARNALCKSDDLNDSHTSSTKLQKKSLSYFL